MSRSEKVLPLAIAILAPAISLLNNSLYLNKIDYISLTINYFQGSIILLVLWYLNKWLLYKTEKSDKKTKYGIIVGVNGILALLTSAFSASGLAAEIAGEFSFLFVFVRMMLIILVFNIIFRVFQEQKKNADLQVQNLSLKTENLKFQVDILKQQINPHFLFNSLNTLLDLVENESEDAVEYIQNFSGLYRNVLQSAQYDFITLNQELEFLDAYANLLGVRFKNGFQLKIEIEVSKKHLMIPPLSLQFLVENAVKHNQLSEDEPLRILIKEVENMLIISNKMKLKEFPVPSEKVGLINLQQRFSILHQPISWASEKGYFKVKLPLKYASDAN